MLALLLMLTSCAAKEDSAPAATSTPEAPDDAAEENAQSDEPEGILSEFTTVDLDGKEVTAQSAFAGYDLIMINVWGTFCGPCISEMPDLAQLSDELAEKNIRIIGIVSDGMGYDGSIDPAIAEAAKEIVAKTGADYLHLMPSQDLMGLLYQIQAVPTTFFVDENGCQVGYSYAGARDKEAWMEIIEETLAERS